MLRSFRMAHLRHYLLLILFKSPNFLMATVVYYFALQCFDLHLPYLQLLVFLPVIFLSAALPIGVAHLGRRSISGCTSSVIRRRRRACSPSA
jgi:hypothetical protein